MIKASNIMISPIKSVLFDLEEDGVDYMLFSSEIEDSFNEKENVLFLHFLDIENSSDPLSFQKYQADAIVKFISRPEANKDLFVCCDSGESRSSAVAAAILLAIGKTDKDIWESVEYHPNKLVFSKMCKALHINLSEEAIQERKRKNDAVFNQTIMLSRNKEITDGKEGA